MFAPRLFASPNTVDHGRRTPRCSLYFATKEELLNAVLDNRDQFEDTQLWRDGPDPGLAIFGIVADIVRSWADQPEVVGLLAVLLAENVETMACCGRGRGCAALPANRPEDR